MIAGMGNQLLEIVLSVAKRQPFDESVEAELAPLDEVLTAITSLNEIVESLAQKCVSVVVSDDS